jgi:hypothetical protein
MSANTRNDILKWTKLAEKMVLNEAEGNKVSNSEKLDKELYKTDNKIMGEKLKKLNMLIKKKYYEKDDEMPDEKMFQFRFEDRGDYYEFSMPLNILFGPATRDFCAKYWNDFFEKADIRTTFKDNIDAALKQAGSIMLTMRLNKSLTKEVEPPKKEGENENE